MELVLGTYLSVVFRLFKTEPVFEIAPLRPWAYCTIIIVLDMSYNNKNSRVTRRSVISSTKNRRAHVRPSFQDHSVVLTGRVRPSSKPNTLERVILLYYIIYDISNKRAADLYSVLQKNAALLRSSPSSSSAVLGGRCVGGGGTTGLGGCCSSSDEPLL